MSDTGTGHKSRNEPATSTRLASRVEACSHRKPSGQPVLPDPAPKQTRHKRHLCPATQAAMRRSPDNQSPASDDNGRTCPCTQCRLTPRISDGGPVTLATAETHSRRSLHPVCSATTYRQNLHHVLPRFSNFFKSSGLGRTPNHSAARGMSCLYSQVAPVSSSAP